MESNMKRMNISWIGIGGNVSRARSNKDWPFLVHFHHLPALHYSRFLLCVFLFYLTWSSPWFYSIHLIKHSKLGVLWKNGKTTIVLVVIGNKKNDDPLWLQQSEIIVHNNRLESSFFYDPIFTSHQKKAASVHLPRTRILLFSNILSSFVTLFAFLHFSFNHF